MAEAGKETIYVDVDDEITSIIDKVVSSKHKIVALVLPKRAAMLQSIVNMKLLKRSGDSHKKNLVLITSEASLMPLAGAVKLHVAKSLQSKPAIPAAPKVPSDELALDDEQNENDIQDEAENEEKEPQLDSKKSVGELAKPASLKTLDDTIELDDVDDLVADAPEKKNTKSAKALSKAQKKLKIPNFDRFRKKTLLIGGGLFLLLISWAVGSFILPSAKITIKTDDISVATDITFTANTALKSLDTENNLIPAVEKQVKKTDAEKVTATGQKNVGEKASGTVTLKLANCAQQSADIPTGTVVSNGSLNFITQDDVSLTSFYKTLPCKNDTFPSFTSRTVKVVAQSAGDQFNINGGRAFSVAGFSEVSGVDSSSMSGGTNKNITVVSDQDIETAKQKLNDKSKDSALKELTNQLDSEQLFALNETFVGATPEVTSSPKVGDEASEVTVTSIVNYTMLGVKRDELKTLVVNEAKKKIDTNKQSIGDDGLSKAVIRIANKKSTTEQQLSVQTTVSTGTQIDQEALKKELAGKKKGDVQNIIGGRPGVKEVEVKYSPFWVYTTPKKTSKIHLVFEQFNNDNN